MGRKTHDRVFLSRCHCEEQSDATISTLKHISQNTLRLLDANLNRCREGLRVLEDTARFVWNDEKLFLQFRGERHLLDHLTRKHYPQLIHARNSQQDDGRTLPEKGRKNIKSVVTANFRRCEESLRVLEEYGKVFSKSAASKFKAIRFKFYNLEKKILEKL